MMAGFIVLSAGKHYPAKSVSDDSGGEDEFFQPDAGSVSRVTGRRARV
jgi:hypothetical protein